jgi:hypothetical protein
MNPSFNIARGKGRGRRGILEPTVPVKPPLGDKCTRIFDAGTIIIKGWGYRGNHRFPYTVGFPAKIELKIDYDSYITIIINHGKGSNVRNLFK